MIDLTFHPSQNKKNATLVTTCVPVTMQLEKEKKKETTTTTTTFMTGP
jgi:hypothetical protein